LILLLHLFLLQRATYQSTRVNYEFVANAANSLPVADSLAAWSNVLRHIVGFQEMLVFAPILAGDVSMHRLRSFRQLPRSNSAAKIEIKFYS